MGVKHRRRSSITALHRTQRRFRLVALLCLSFGLLCLAFTFRPSADICGHYSTSAKGANAAVWQTILALPLWVGADTKNSRFVVPEAVPRCQEGLMRFYCSASQAPQLQGNSLAWREGELDEALCRAGLWGCPRKAEAPTVRCPARRSAEEVRVGFIVLVSDNSMKGSVEPQMLHHMLQALEDPAFQVVLHVDKNSSPAYRRAVQDIAAKFLRVSLVTHPVPANWGGPSVTASELSAMGDLVFGFEEACLDLVVNLSDSDFPVQSPEGIQAVLRGALHDIRLDYFPQTGSADAFLQEPEFSPDVRYPDRFYLPECWRIPVSIEGKDMQPWTLHGPRRHPSIASWQVVQGSQWWVLPRAAVVYLVTDPSVKLLWHYIKHTHIPDESFWHTALVNAPHLNATIKPGALRYIGRRGNHRVVEDSDSPALASCQHLFARKFSSAEEALRLTQGPRSACNVEPSTPQRTTTRTRLSVLALMQNHPKTQG